MWKWMLLFYYSIRKSSSSMDKWWDTFRKIKLKWNTNQSKAMAIYFLFSIFILFSSYLKWKNFNIDIQDLFHFWKTLKTFHSFECEFIRDITPLIQQINDMEMYFSFFVFCQINAQVNNKKKQEKKNWKKANKKKKMHIGWRKTELYSSYNWTKFFVAEFYAKRFSMRCLVYLLMAKWNRVKLT